MKRRKNSINNLCNHIKRSKSGGEWEWVSEKERKGRVSGSEKRKKKKKRKVINFWEAFYDDDDGWRRMRYFIEHGNSSCCCCCELDKREDDGQHFDKKKIFLGHFMMSRWACVQNFYNTLNFIFSSIDDKLWSVHEFYSPFLSFSFNYWTFL